LQIESNPGKPDQARAKPIKEKGLESLVRIEPFQGVALIPEAKILFPAPCLPSPFAAPAHFISRRPQGTMTSEFRKEKSSSQFAIQGGNGFMIQCR
jgi:hypothetical protein